MSPDVPDELKSLDQWVLWRAEPRGGRVSKIPYSVNGRRASSTNPDDWASFKAVCEAYAAPGQGRQYSGLGFVFAPDGHLCGVDLDHCLDERGVIEPWAGEVVRSFDSYTECSPSGHGLHIFASGVIPGGKGHRRGQVEVYDRARYFTVTGDAYGGPRSLREAQAVISKLLEWIGRDKQRTPARRPPARRRYLNNGELLEKARGARNGEKFRSLFDHGTVAGYRSHSEADLALASMLLYWADGDEDRAGELFRQSALYRPKWDRADYRRRCFSYLKGQR
jgi:primase-polymerase (primpol)-like protein